MATPVKTPSKPTAPVAVKKTFVPILNKENYVILGVGALLLIVGYVIMSGGQQKPTEWKVDEVYSFRRITLAPIMVVLGYIAMGVGILWHSKEKKQENAR